jgi:methyl-accepting chemotaxis protein
MNVSVRQKLLFNALFGIALMLVIGAAGYFGVHRVDDAMNQIVGNSKALRHQMFADMMHEGLKADVYEAMAIAAHASQKERDKMIADTREHSGEFRKAIDTLAASDIADEIKRDIARIRPVLDRYVVSANEIVGLAFSEPAQAQAKIPQFNEAFAKVEREMEMLSDHIEASTAASQQDAGRAVDVANVIVLAVLAFAVLGLIVLSFVLSRKIVVPLDRALRVADAVAAGDLTVEIERAGRDEVGRLLAALEKMRTDLTNSVHSIQVAAGNVNSGTKEIARGNADLSSRTEEQASSLEETASSMEELTTTVKQNAENARQANQLAAGASDVATRGGVVVRSVITTMEGISESSRRISDIIAVIDGISFQTNILALNAAVEAARAGEQGRGFAVVASEVRALAQRSAAAAKEIKGLIEDSVTRVEDGARLVDGAGETMDEIVSSVKRVTDIVSEISAASQEQLRGIEQVSQAIMQIDNVVQQNAALVEESAAAAENLASQAEVMNDAVSRFRLDERRYQVPVALGIEGAAELPSPARTRLQAPPAATVRQETRKEVGAPGKRTALPKPATARAKPPKGDGEDDWKEF